MPLNEARGPQRSGLTKEEKRQAEAAVFGLPEKARTMSDLQLTSEEIERMRAIVAQHDNAGKAKEFDLNKPPVEAYSHKEFPRVVYNHKRKTQKLVHTKAELDKHVTAGWKTEPFVSDPPEDPDLDPAERAEAAAIDAQLKKKPKAE